MAGWADEPCSVCGKANRDCRCGAGDRPPEARVSRPLCPLCLRDVSLMDTGPMWKPEGGKAVFAHRECIEKAMEATDGQEV